MAFNSNITPGRPPLLWSDMYDAFVKVNENFDILVATVGDGSGLTPVDFSSLDTDVSPSVDNLRSLGNITNKWKAVFAGEHTVSDPLNGLWAGNAQIKGIGLTVNLPAGTTIGGDPLTGIGTNLIIDADKTFFKTAQVDNAESVVANEFADTLNLNSGIAMQLVVDSAAESITFNNTGVIGLFAGSGVSVDAAVGNVTVSNTGVRSLQSVTALPSGRSSGAGINVNGSTGDNLRITNTGILEVQQGFGITVSTDNATGIATVSFNSGVAPQTAFTRFHIDGDNSVNDIVSDSIADIFNLSQGYGITLTNDALSDTLTIAVNSRIDIVGSVFADNSTLLVDGPGGRIPAEVVQGTFTGSVVGNVTGNVSGTAGVATTVTLTATESTAATHFVTFVDTATGNENVRTDTSLTYNPSTNVLTAGTFNGSVTGTVTGNIFTNLIDSADSSAITVTPLTIFSSDVVVENDLIVTQQFLLRGSRVLNLTDLKAVVAVSASFSDFQARIAALV